MKTSPGLVLSLCLMFSVSARAQDSATEAVSASPEPAATQFTAEQLDQLLGPIALYPDALIALILPASTAPTDLVLAARYLGDGGDPAAVDSRAWDDSVKALTHYPEVVTWMDQNLEWTMQLSQAFRDQPAAVMEAIQRLRARARATGALADNAEQQVVTDDSGIRIIPAQPEVIYVPYYDPQIVYMQPAPDWNGSYMTYSAGFAAGPWLLFDCDWRHHAIWMGDRHHSWSGPHDWRNPVFPGQAGYVPDPNRRLWRPTAAPQTPGLNARRRQGTTVVAAPSPAGPAAAASQPANRPPHVTPARPTSVAGQPVPAPNTLPPRYRAPTAGTPTPSPTNVANQAAASTDPNSSASRSRYRDPSANTVARPAAPATSAVQPSPAPTLSRTTPASPGYSSPATPPTYHSTVAPPLPSSGPQYSARTSPSGQTLANPVVAPAYHQQAPSPSPTNTFTPHAAPPAPAPAPHVAPAPPPAPAAPAPAASSTDDKNKRAN